MRWGLSEPTITKISEVLAGFPAIKKAVIYGSRVKNTYKNGSDIDLTLLGIDLNQQLLSQIDITLDDTMLPYTIDLSIFTDINHVALREHI